MKNLSLTIIVVTIALIAINGAGGEVAAIYKDSFVNPDTNRRICRYEVDGTSVYSYISPQLECDKFLMLER